MEKKVVEGGEVEGEVESCVDENGSLGRKKRIKEKEKWKRNDKEKIFLLEGKMKIMKVADSRDSVADAESFGKIPESSEIQVSRNDPK